MATNRQIIMLALSPLGPEATAAKLGISSRWVYTLVARYRAEGEAAFEPHSKRPRTRPARTPHVVTSFAAAFHERGRPASVLTDSGLVFIARFARGGGDNAKNGLENLLHIHGIRQINGRPGHPQTQGKIERFHQTLKKWLAAQPAPQTLAALEALLGQFQRYYNQHRPHGAIGRRTPAVAYAALPKAVPGEHPSPETRLREDTVGPDGKVTLRYAGKLRHLGIGRAQKRQRVRILVIGDEAIVALAKTAEVIAAYDLDPTKNYHAKQPHAADQRTRTKE